MVNVHNIYEQTKKLSVLLVEDDAQLRLRTSEILEDYFYSVDTAIDGMDGLAKYTARYEEKNSYFDLVISDIQMPGMDGVEMTRAIYALNKEQPVVILSGHTESDYLLALINLGVAQFITKPIQYDKMLDTLYTVSLKINSTKGTVSILTNTVRLSEQFVWDKEKEMLLENGEIVSLSKYELILMDLLILKFEQVCSSDEIVNHFFLHDADISMESLRGMMMRLRKKLPPNALNSIYGLGYRLMSV